MPGDIGSNDVTIVSIMKWEERFVKEWLAYHQMMGVSRFIIYDDDSREPLKALFEPLRDRVTVIPWADSPVARSAPSRQIAAYEDALKWVTTRWVAFIDCDEFIVLRNADTIPSFLANFQSFGAVLLTWHMFGHNGYYDDPAGLITAALTRRQQLPGNQTKVIAQTASFLRMKGPHDCISKLKKVDANQRPFTSELYEGKTALAHINHYFCRSYHTWMRRVERGDVLYAPANCPEKLQWRFSEEGAMRRFVKLSRDTNEVVDDYMLKYTKAIKRQMAQNERAGLVV